MILFFTNVSAQIDTSVYYPLSTGNIWEYWGIDNWSTDWIRLTLESIKDTTLANGNTYHKFVTYEYRDTLPGYLVLEQFYRFESNRLYTYYESDSCANFEYILFDFDVADSTIWQICSLGFANHRGIDHTDSYYSMPLNQSFEVKLFDYVNVNGFDTTWAPMGAPTSERIAKGLGMINQLVWDWALFELYGAKINGKVYGTLTSNRLEEEQVKSYKLSQNFPNPFNPATTILYEIPKNDFVIIKVYDVLGKEVKELVHEEKPAGKHEVEFNGSNLPSGVYIYRITAGKYTAARKLLLLK